MSRDLHQLLERTAESPTRALDTGRVAARGRRRRIVARASATLGGAGLAVAAALLVIPALAPAPPAPEVGEDPGGDAAARDEAATATSDRLWGETYRATEVLLDGVPHEAFVDTPVVVTFTDEVGDGAWLLDGADDADDADGEITWQAACNRTHARIGPLDDGRIVITGDEVVVTSMGCTEDEQQQDEWLWTFFTAEPSWELDGEQLRLRGQDAVLLLVAE